MLWDGRDRGVFDRKADAFAAAIRERLGKHQHGPNSAQPEKGEQEATAKKAQPLSQNLPQKPRGAFAIIHTWPELRNAEYEVVQRILAAAARVSRHVAVVDNYGYVVWADKALNLTPRVPLPVDAVDFLISLHFESPRVVDLYSYYALWQPLDFYRDFGYERSVDKFSSHNDIISCSSDIADAHALNRLAGLNRPPLTPLPPMFHALPEPFLPPNITKNAKLFYIGINWERIGRPKGRFHDTLTLLDREGLTEIYGPQKMLGVAPWEGFRTYVGELPFDGSSVKQAINHAGVCLALSSEPHKATGIMSNRLFEGFAGGAAVIATPNPLIDKFFSDCVYLVDDSHGEEILGKQIVAALEDIRARPTEAKRRALEGQRVMREHCSLEQSIEDLFLHHQSRRNHFREVALADVLATVIVTFESGSNDDLEEIITSLQMQENATLDVHLLVDDGLIHPERMALNAISGAIRSLEFHPGVYAIPATAADTPKRRTRTGAEILRILREAKTPCFALLDRGDQLFSDHFATLAKALADTPAALMSSAGLIASQRDADGTEKRYFQSLRFDDLDSIILIEGPPQKGRFLFKTSLVADDLEPLFSLLDGEEHRFFRLLALLSGPLAQSNYASYVARDSVVPDIRIPPEAEAAQQQYIRDRFAGDARWLELLARRTPLPQFVYAYGPGAPVRWHDYTPPHGIAIRVEPDRAYETRVGGDGLGILREGFSHPEVTHVWLAAERGIIEFSLPPGDAASIDDFEIVINAEGRPSMQTGRRQHCTISVNGMTVAYLRVPHQPADMRFIIPRDLRRQHDTFRVEITPDHAELVYDDAGTVIDNRRLSIMLRVITIKRCSPREAPILTVGTRHSCGRSKSGIPALSRGFAAPERSFSWLLGTEGEIRFRVDHTPARPYLELTLHGRRSTGGFPQRAAISLNGRSLGTIELNEHPKPYAIELNAEDVGARTLVISLKASHAEPMQIEDDIVIDGRMTGIAVHSIALLDLAERARTRRNLSSRLSPTRFFAKQDT